MGHGTGIVILARLAVGPGFHDHVVRIGDFVLGDDPRPAAAVAALAFADKLRAAHEPTSGNVEDRHVAEDIIEGLVCGDILRCFADDEGELRFGLVNYAGRNVPELDRFTGADEVGRLVEIFVREVIRRAPGPIDVVTEGREKFAGPRERRMNFYARHRYAALFGENLLEAP